MNKIILTLSLICCSIIFCANDDSGDGNNIYNQLKRTLESIPSWMQKVDLKELESTVRTFIEKTSFPLSNTTNDHIKKSKTALYGRTDSTIIKELIDRAHIENEYGKIANQRGNMAACIAPLMFVPLLRSVRGVGLIALGTCAAFKMQAASHYPQYDISTLQEEYDASIDNSTKK